MKENLYTAICPSSGQRVHTKRTKTVLYNGKEFSGPIYYCTRCKCYYLHIPMLPKGGPSGEVAPSGLKIKYVRNMGIEKIKPKKNKGKKDVAKGGEDITKKKKTINLYVSSCPVHNVELRTPSRVVKQGEGLQPIFYCTSCQKYYIYSALEEDNKVIGRMRGKNIVNMLNYYEVKRIEKSKVYSSNAVLEEVEFFTNRDLVQTDNKKKEKQPEYKTIPDEIPLISNEDTEEKIDVQTADFIENKERKKMGLNDFSITKERALSIFVLADTSGSMAGEKIQAVNKAIQEMASTLRNVNDIRGVFKISIITFGGDQVTVHQYPVDVQEFEFEELQAAGKTPMGEAISVVTELIEDREIVKPKDYLPTVVLISDGYPTDFLGSSNASVEEYLEWGPIKAMHEGERSKKCMRIAMSVDADTDLNMLRAFLNNGGKPMRANDAADIAKAFQWITMSSISRMSSTNPNDVQSFLKWDDEDEDEVII